MCWVWTALLTISNDTNRTTSEALGVLVKSVRHVCRPEVSLRSWLRYSTACAFRFGSDRGSHAISMAFSIYGTSSRLVPKFYHIYQDFHSRAWAPTSAETPGLPEAVCMERHTWASITAVFSRTEAWDYSRYKVYEIQMIHNYRQVNCMYIRSILRDSAIES